MTRCQGHLSGMVFLYSRLGLVHSFQSERSGFEDGSSSRVEAWCHKVTLWYPRLHKLLVVMESPLALFSFGVFAQLLPCFPKGLCGVLLLL